MNRLIYIIGQPGSGKSTAVNLALAHLRPYPQRKPFAHIIYRNNDLHHVATQLGATHPTFPGTDRLSMGVQPAAATFLKEHPAPVVIAEGDRLGNLMFLTVAAVHGYHVTLIRLQLPDDLAAERRATRGTEQNDTWLRGRITKVNNLYERWQGDRYTIDSSTTPDLVAAHIRQLAGLDT